MNQIHPDPVAGNNAGTVVSAAAIEHFPPTAISRMGTFHLRPVVGDSWPNNDCDVWRWLKLGAPMMYTNLFDCETEYMIEISTSLLAQIDQVPETIRAVVIEADRKGLQWVLFHYE